MTDAQQRAAAKEFSESWKGKGYEKGDSQTFWLSLLQEVYGIEKPREWITFEEQVHLDHTSFIDAYIPQTRVMIEQKSIEKDLRKAIRQSDGTWLTPYQQAKRYITELPVSQHPRWVVTCNFKTFLVYDMEHPNAEPEEILLERLPEETYRLNFLTDVGDSSIKKEMEISMKAGELVGLLYDALLSQYKDPTSDSSLKSLNMLCVRLVFCLYAEDAGVFGKHSMFHDYLKGKGAKAARQALIALFKTLDTKPEDRDPYLAEDDPELAAFPYVNGGLFADESIEIPALNEEIYTLLLSKASKGFDWSQISPTIFGAVFESTLNPETRRKGGMHYTSIENIHKVIDPLFLDGLKAELTEIKEIAVERTRQKRLKDFQEKLAGLTFLDPAAGSGNFLTETYLCLRRLENEVLSERFHGQVTMGLDNVSPIQVSIRQFYGIEINDFAVTVAKTALWIAESQMLKQTEDIVHMNLDFLPLKSYANITEGNALRLDWNDVIPSYRLNYIMGNPPFVGYAYQSPVQKKDLQSTMEGIGKNIDYVAGWYIKASQYIQGTNITVAFVSTNSITQGEQVESVWKPLFINFGIHIDFAYQTFRWDSEANDKAHVHCVIIGFSHAKKNKLCKLFTEEKVTICENINAYLLNAPDVFVGRRSKPLCDVPEMNRGSQPTDDGNLIINQEEYNEFIKAEPQAKPLIRPFMMGKDFIERKPRYCLWLVGVNPSLIRKCPAVVKRIQRVQEYRLNSPKEATRKKAETPTLFDEIRVSNCDYVAIPKVSSENRRYIPIDYLSKEIIAGDKLFMMPSASIYCFGVLTSSVHMAWMRAVAGRLEMRYSYSNTIVYNNFPWPTPTEAQRAKIEKTAQAILDARALYPDCSLADLYDEAAMPPELRKAHQQNDIAVLEAYGIDKKHPAYASESACVAELMRRYQALTETKN